MHKDSGRELCGLFSAASSRETTKNHLFKFYGLIGLLGQANL
jgi:hypothetical protein